MKAFFLALGVFLRLQDGSHGWILTSIVRDTARHDRWPRRRCVDVSSIARNRQTVPFSLWSRLSASPSVGTGQEDIFLRAFHEMGFTQEEDLLLAMQRENLWDDESGSHLLRAIGRDYFTSQQPDHLTRMLQTDFHLQAIHAHTVRSILWKIYSDDGVSPPNSKHAEAAEVVELAKADGTDSAETRMDENDYGAETIVLPEPPSIHDAIATNSQDVEQEDMSDAQRPLYKDVGLTLTTNSRSEYSLLSLGENNQTKTLFQEVDQFWHEFMTRPNPYHPTTTPLRNATAKVYARHAYLFLGWCLHEKPHAILNSTTPGTPVSLRTIFPDASIESASILLDFVRWLREDRNIASSYEANLWRGLTKLVQFRHTHLEGRHAPVLEYIPALGQIRKWHNEASIASKKAPRRSQEEKKWLSWDEYLEVVKRCKEDFLALQQECLSSDKQRKSGGAVVTPLERRVAVALQRYLVLAIFTVVPDRQRTIRELEINKSLVHDSASGIWSIKHSPDAYKTGKTYGERPLLQLNGLTEDLDLFLERWRPKLEPLTDRLFVQPRTHRPLTQDSVYQIVGRACYQFTGQRTNPHLLRDMIVTHVRESKTATEQELEALAMLMGHSVAVQRASYDRRTLSQKVAPAVDLMQKVNSGQTNR